MIEFLALVFALAFGTAIGLHMQAQPKLRPADLAELKRARDEAVRGHKRRSHIDLELQRAVTDNLRRGA